MNAEPAAEPVPQARRLRLLSIVSRLASVNLALLAVGVVTGPLLARSLGPAGRGELVAILAPVAVAVVVLAMGLQFYAFRAASQGMQIGSLLGTIGALVVPLGLLGVVIGPFVGELVGGGHTVVVTLVTVGFALMPVSLAILLISDVLAGLERWNIVVAMRLIPAVVQLTGVAALYIIGELTVTSAALVSILGGTLPVVFLIPLARKYRPFRFDRSIAKKAIPFGLKSWAWSLGALLNARFDQVLMTGLVDSRELGLYAIAVTVAGVLVYSLAIALSSATMPRFATGDIHLVSRVLRVTLFGVFVISAAVALVAPILVPFAFGPDFRAAVPMVWILLLAGFPLVGCVVANSAMVSFGHPGYSAWCELIALAVTVPALFWLAPLMGGTGAALVSLIAYSTSFGMILVIMCRRYDTRLSELLLIRPADLAALRPMVLEQIPSWLPIPTKLAIGKSRSWVWGSLAIPILIPVRLTQAISAAPAPPPVSGKTDRGTPLRTPRPKSAPAPGSAAATEQAGRRVSARLGD
jgi:O-antigen/teichoic acid export membrane protein